MRRVESFRSVEDEQVRRHLRRHRDLNPVPRRFVAGGKCVRPFARRRNFDGKSRFLYRHRRPTHRPTRPYTTAAAAPDASSRNPHGLFLSIRPRSFSFSQNVSIRSESGSRLTGTFARQGFRYAFGSSIVMSMIEVPDVAPREALGHARRVGLRMPRSGVDPGAAVQPVGLDYQRVAFPASDRIAQPAGLRIASGAAGRRGTPAGTSGSWTFRTAARPAPASGRS